MVKHDVNKSAGRSAFVGSRSLGPHASSTIKSLPGGSEPENIPPPALPTEDDVIDVVGRPTLLDEDGAALPVNDEGAPAGVP